MRYDAVCLCYRKVYERGGGVGGAIPPSTAGLNFCHFNYKSEKIMTLTAFIEYRGMYNYPCIDQ